MLDVIRRGQRWLTALFVVSIGGVFAVFIGLGSPMRRSRADSVVVVADQRIGIGEFERTREQQEQRYAQQFGDGFDARKLREPINEATAQLLVERGILALEAEALGLTVAKQEVEREILGFRELRDETGAFDAKRFRDWVDYNFGSERNFRQQQRRATLSNKLLRVLTTEAEVSEGEAREAVRQRFEKVKLAFPVLSATAAAQESERDEAAVAAYLADHGAEVQKLYQERIAEYDVPEQAHARHILVALPAGASDAEVQEKRQLALEIRGRLESGEDFATVAREVSEDPGSAANGGDLGWFRRGQMVPAFDAAAFSLEIGALSEPVQSDFGFHLIRVEGRKQARLQTLEDVQGDLAFELMTREAGLSKAREQADHLAQQVRDGKSLETAAREAGLTLERTDWLTRRPDGYVPGLGAAPDLMAVAFTLEPGESSDRVFEAGDDKLALVQVLDHEMPDEAVVEAQIEAERSRLRQERLEAMVDTWVSNRRTQLAEAGQLAVDLSLVN